MATTEVLEEILSHMENLPELPAVALQVSRMLDNPNSSAQDLAKVIMQDPSLTTKVLKLCNSAEYGFSRKIATISEAVSILGGKELKQIIYTVITHGLFNRPVHGYALEKGELWDNALTCAAYAKRLAQRFSFKDPELAFVAALLRDIGKIALEGYLEGRGNLVEAAAKEHKCSFAEAEEHVVGTSHTEVGRGLASKWNLPDSLVKVITYHHKPSEMPPDTPPQDLALVCIVHLADTFTMMSGRGVGLDGLMYPLDMCVFQHLSLALDSEVLEALFAELLLMNDEINGMSSSMDNQGK